MQSGYWGRNGVDPKPGRCKKTDRKKWRCSRDVVVGCKYCEPHLNRGRNHSRKPVEIPTPTSTGGVGCGLNPTSIGVSSLIKVANASPFALYPWKVKQEMEALGLRAAVLQVERGGQSSEVYSGISLMTGQDCISIDPNIPTCLSISIPGNGNGCTFI